MNSNQDNSIESTSTNSTNSNYQIDCGNLWKIPSTSNCYNCYYIRHTNGFAENTLCNECSVEQTNAIKCNCNKCVCSKLAWGINTRNFTLIEETIDFLSPNACSIALLKIIPIISNLDIVEILIKRGANINFIADYDEDNIKKNNVLGAAVYSKMGLPLFKYLLENGANPNLCSGRNNPLFAATILPYKCVNKSNEISNIIDLLLAHNIDIEKSGVTLNDVVQTKNITLLKYFLEHPNFEEHYKSLSCSPINNGCLTTDSEVLDLLFSNPLIKADINKYDNKYGKTPLNTALSVININLDLVERLLIEGANPYIFNKNSKNCFKHYFQKKDIEVVKLLLRYGVSFSEIKPYLLGFNTSTEGWESILHWDSDMLLYCISQLNSDLNSNLNNIMTSDIVEELVQTIQTNNEDYLWRNLLNTRSRQPNANNPIVLPALPPNFVLPPPPQHLLQMALDIPPNLVLPPPPPNSIISPVLQDFLQYNPINIVAAPREQILQQVIPAPPPQLPQNNQNQAEAYIVNPFPRTRAYNPCDGRFPIVDFLNQLSILDGYSYLSEKELSEYKKAKGFF